MGYTHHDGISATGSGGFAVGAKGSELEVIDSSGHVTGSENVVFNVAAHGTIGAYIVAPFDLKMDACYADVSGGTLGEGVVLQLFANDTAGTALCTAIAIGASTGTAGSSTVTVGTLSTATVSALSSIVVLATSATAVTTNVTLVASRQ